MCRHRGTARAGRRVTILGAVLGVISLGCDTAGPRAPAVGAPPTDIIVVMIDTLRTDHMSLYGYPKPTTPEIEAFARTADDYRRAYAQSSWTAPSVSSFLTSRYPRELGEHVAPSKLPADARTLARVLDQRGYHTAGVFTNRYISTRYGHEIGYDRFEERLAHGETVTSDVVTDVALDLVREASPDEPLFLYAHYFDPHYDYVMHPGFELGPASVGLPVHNGVVSFIFQAWQATRDESDMAESRKHYDSEIAFTDYHVGRLLTGLRALGRFDDAVVVVVADHGEEFLEHDNIGHAGTVYDELVHVPLLIKAPGQNRGRRFDTPVALLDAAPTILDLAGLPPEPTHLGTSLRRTLQVEPIFTSTFHFNADQVGIVHGRYKAIMDYPGHNFMMFDLEADPYEQHSIVEEQPERAALMQGRLEAWNEGPFWTKRGKNVDLSEREKAIMRSLGYGE